MTQPADWAQKLWQKQGLPEGWDLPCPMCDYNLRGTTEPRCPECGFRFAWDELLDPTRRRHPYLYEHRTLDSFVAFWRTLAHGLLPWRFWKTLHPAQPSDPRRLRRYFLWCMLPLIAAVIAAFMMQVLADDEIIEWNRARDLAILDTPAAKQNIIHRFGSAEAYIAAVDHEWPRVSSLNYLAVRRGAAFRQILFWPLLPLLEFAALMIFQASMRKARVKVIHVWRCVVYSWDTTLIVGLVLCLFAVLFVSDRMPFYRSWPILGGQTFMGHPLEFLIILQWGMMLLLFISGLKLAFAYRLYLRFDHPEYTIASVQLILFLLVAALASLNVI